MSIQDTKTNIRGVVTSSGLKTSYTTQQLLIDYEQMMGTALPLHNFNSYKQLLESLTDTIVLHGHWPYQTIQLVSSQQSAHIENLVLGQKVGKATRIISRNPARRPLRTVQQQVSRLNPKGGIQKVDNRLQPQRSENKCPNLQCLKTESVSGLSSTAIETESKTEPQNTASISSNNNLQVPETLEQISEVKDEPSSPKPEKFLLESTKTFIRGIVASSGLHGGYTTDQLIADFNDIVGYPMPLHNFENCNLMLESLTDTIILHGNVPSQTVELVSSDRSSHIEKLVLGQKNNRKRRSASYIPPRKVRPQLFQSPARALVAKARNFLQRSVSRRHGRSDDNRGSNLSTSRNTSAYHHRSHYSTTDNYNNQPNHSGAWSHYYSAWSNPSYQPWQTGYSYPTFGYQSNAVDYSTSNYFGGQSYQQFGFASTPSYSYQQYRPSNPFIYKEVLIFGDSNIRGLKFSGCKSRIFSWGDLELNRDWSEEIYRTVRKSNAKYVVVILHVGTLNVGHRDYYSRQDPYDYANIMERLVNNLQYLRRCSVLVSGLLPITGGLKSETTANNLLAKLCRRYGKNVNFIRTHYPFLCKLKNGSVAVADDLYERDKRHLNERGMQKLSSLLSLAVKRSGYV